MARSRSSGPRAASRTPWSTLPNTLRRATASCSVSTPGRLYSRPCRGQSGSINPDGDGSRSSSAGCPPICRGRRRPASMSPFMRRLANGSVPRADEPFKKLVRLVRLVRELHAFPENARGVLRHHGVDVEAGAPFESRGLREPRRDLEMPVVLGLLAVAGGCVDVIVEGRIVEDAEHSTQDVFEDAGERGALVVRDVFEGHLMGLREDPGLERKPGRVGG